MKRVLTLAVLRLAPLAAIRAAEQKLTIDTATRSNSY
jgi:hypothetical protein